MRHSFSVCKWLFLIVFVSSGLSVIAVAANAGQKPSGRASKGISKAFRNPNLTPDQPESGPAFPARKTLTAERVASGGYPTVSNSPRIFLPETTDTLVVNVPYDSAAKSLGTPYTAGGKITIRSAIESTISVTSSTTVIIVPAGSYVLSIPGSGESLGLTGDLDVNGDVIIQGVGESQTVIYDSTGDRIFNIGPSTPSVSVKIADLTMTGGASPDSGGGINLGGTSTLELDSVQIIGCVAKHFGGGINIANGNLTMNYGTVSHDSTDTAGETEQGGGVNVVSGTVIFNDVTIDSNYATNGAGIQNQSSGGGTITLTGCSLVGNYVYAGAGGAIDNDNGSLTVTGGTISHNFAVASGGVDLDAGSIHMSRVTVDSNSAQQSIGGIGLFSGSPFVLDSDTVSYNSAPGIGGSIISNCSSLTMHGDNIFSNSSTGAGDGGIEIYGATSPVLSDITITGNIAAGNAGGLDVESSSGVVITNTTVSNNISGSDGGGIYSQGSPLHMTNVSITGNVAASQGGGLWMNDSLFMSGGSIIDNRITGNVFGTDNAGGLYFGGIRGEMHDVAFHGNTAPSNIPSGGIDVLNSGALDAPFCYWGTASGPAVYNGSYVGGQGDTVYQTTYSPWLGYAAGTHPMTYHFDNSNSQDVQLAEDSTSANDTLSFDNPTGYTNDTLWVDKALNFIGDNSSGVLKMTISPSGSLNLTRNFIVGDSLIMDGGNISAGNDTLTLDTLYNANSLQYSSGTIVGTLQRYLGIMSNGDVVFPVGTASDSRELELNGLTSGSAGSVAATFVASDPGTNGLPLTDGGNILNHVYSSGYWTTSGTGDFSAAANYKIYLTTAGFGSMTDSANLHIVYRATSSNSWGLNGTFASSATASAGVVARRYQVTDLGQFAIADSVHITPPSIQASNLTFSQMAEHSVKLNWTNGNGQYRIVVAKTGSALSPSVNAPSSGSGYTADSSFGGGSMIGSNAYVVYDGTGSSVTVTDLPADNYCYFAVYEYNGTVGSETYLTTSPATGTDSTESPSFASEPGDAIAIRYNGSFSYSYVDVTNSGTASQFSLRGSFTIEGWFKCDQTFSTWNAIVNKGDNAWRVQAYNGTHNLDFGTSGLSSQDLKGTTTVDDGRWHFFAAVYDTSRAAKYLYVDGKLDTEATSVTGTLSTDTTSLAIGNDLDITDNSRVFNGDIDEVRIWTIARTEAQIRNDMFTTTVGTQNGLLDYWQFNEGSGTTTADSVSGFNGTLTGAGILPTWVTSGAPVGIYGGYDSSSSTDGVGAVGAIISAAITSSPIDSLNFLGLYSYGSPADNGVTTETFPSGVTKRSSVIWGIFGVGSNAATVTLNYGGLTGIQNEPGLHVLERAEADSPWVDVTPYFTQNTTTHQFTIGIVPFGTVARHSSHIKRTFNVSSPTVTSAQYSIGAGSDNSLNVQATDFFATSDAGSVTVEWKTRSEVDNAGFNVLRQQPQTTNQEPLTANWQLIASYTTDDSLRGLGTSSTGRSYDFTDDKVISGDTYGYKIQSVSTNGTTKDLSTLLVTVGVPKSYALYQNYPNPFNPTTVISYQLSALSNVTLKVYDILGREVATLVNGQENAGVYRVNFNGSRFASGVYFYRLTATGNNGKTFSSIKKLVLVK